ncbi:hypothetical protein MZJ60_003545 [Vibrio parahaemolyticus]|nr:hypothetical protein [Vibrio parahaemolyticus]
MFNYQDLDELFDPDLSINTARIHKTKAQKTLKIYTTLLAALLTLAGSYSITTIILPEFTKFSFITATPIILSGIYLLDKVFYWHKVQGLFGKALRNQTPNS